MVGSGSGSADPGHACRSRRDAISVQLLLHTLNRRSPRPPPASTTRRPASAIAPSRGPLAGLASSKRETASRAIAAIARDLPSLLMSAPRCDCRRYVSLQRTLQASCVAPTQHAGPDLCALGHHQGPACGTQTVSSLRAALLARSGPRTNNGLRTPRRHAEPPANPRSRFLSLPNACSQILPDTSGSARGSLSVR
jgi:hypothetical protein